MPLATPHRTIAPARTIDHIMRRCLPIALLVIANAAVMAEDPPRTNDVAAFMRAKLGHSSLVLEGLALEDFTKIGRGAHDLALASQAASWQVLQTEDYARMSGDFRRSCESLRTAAKAENLDAAALAWMEVTMKCIQCHRYVRDTNKAP